MVVLSGSMSGDAKDHIEVGDLIFVGKVKPQELKVGNIIAYMEENSKAVVTHRIVKIEKDKTGKLIFTTKGDANNTVDQIPVTEDRIVGIYQLRIPHIGDFAMFLQEPLGMLLFIGVPLLLFIIYDIVRRQKIAYKGEKETIEMKAELERLRAMVEEKENK